MGGADRIVTWEVFKIDEENGEIQLVPTTTKTRVKLKGANGYNNAVQLLNAAFPICLTDLGIITKRSEKKKKKV